MKRLNYKWYYVPIGNRRYTAKPFETDQVIVLWDLRKFMKKNKTRVKIQWENDIEPY